MKAQLQGITKLAPSIWTISFKPEKPYSFVPGQFIDLTVNSEDLGSRDIRRQFTLSNSPSDTSLQVTTKYVPSRSSSFKEVLFHLPIGAEVSISEPMGDFVLPKDPTIPLVWIAGGIGITPFHSMAGWLAMQPIKRNIQLLYAAHDETEVIFEDDLQRAGIRPTVVLSSPSKAWRGITGRLDGQTVLSLAGPASNTLIYISGPESMVEVLTRSLRELGMTSSRIVQDTFLGYK